ncbi:MAG: hypothetical protein CMD81_16650 [Gammaproteobacteria bacterium]|nr:hypothetical protein [Gammaproteobacteria bacterium]|tara:strand:+ start:849 stop:2249 length:1401 start_codon:yes stop_codon:yes gene_type:complete
MTTIFHIDQNSSSHTSRSPDSLSTPLNELKLANKPIALLLQNTTELRAANNANRIYFIRQLPEEVSVHVKSASIHKNRLNEGTPWLMGRCSAPYRAKSSSLMTCLFPSTADLQDSSAFIKSHTQPYGNIHTSRQSTEIKRNAQEQGLVKIGEKIKQHQSASGDFELYVEPLYSNLGKQTSTQSTNASNLEYYNVHLMDISHNALTHHKKQDNTTSIAAYDIDMAREKMQTLIPKQLKLHQVRVFNLNNNYWLISANIKLNYPQELMTFSHSHTFRQSDRKMTEGKLYGFYAPDNHILLGKHPLLTANTTPSSLHICENGRYRGQYFFTPNASCLSDREFMRYHTGTEKPGYFKEIEFNKFSLKGAPKSERALMHFSLTVNNVKELAYWMAVDSGKDVILPRKHARERLTSLHLEKTLSNQNLLENYKTISFFSCRVRSESSPCYGIEVNPEIGTEAEKTIEMTMTN